MPRSIWSGTISFGLVSIPVRMVGAVSEHALHFNLLHRKDSSPIGYEKVCKQEGKRVPDDEIVKAYEIKKGEFVELDDEDFEAARAEGYHTFDISDFVEVDEIDPIYFERSYYLVPQDGGEKVYTLLVRAMEDAGLAAVGTFVMREREHLGSLRIRDGVIVLERMYFADEIRPTDELKPEPGARVQEGVGDGDSPDRPLHGLVRPVEVLGHVHGEAGRRDQAEAEGRDGEGGAARDRRGGGARPDGVAAGEHRGPCGHHAAVDRDVAASWFVSARRDPSPIRPLAREKPPGGRLSVEPTGLEPVTFWLPAKRSPS